METLIFYISTLSHNKLAESENYSLARLAAKFSSATSYKVVILYESSYYIDFKSILQGNFCDNIEIINITDFDSKKYHNTTYVTTVNQLLFLLKNFSIIGNSKIFLFSFLYKKNELFIKPSKQKKYYCDLSSLLSRNNAIYSTCPDCSYKLINFPLFSDVTSKPFQERKSNRKEFNICYFNDINNQSINSIQNIIKRSEKLDYFSHVNIHIVGNVNNKKIFDYLKKSDSSNKVRLIFPKDLNQIGLEKYLIHNIDVVFAYGQKTFFAMCATLPVAIAPIIVNKQNENGYVWLNEALSDHNAWNNNYIYRGSFHTFESIIFDAYINKKHVADACKKAFYDYAHFGHTKLNIISNLITNSTLTVDKCFSIKEIRRVIKKYRREYYKNDFSLYLKELNNRKLRLKNGLKRRYENAKKHKLLSSLTTCFRKIKNHFFDVCRFVHYSKIVRSFKKHEVLNVAFLVTFKQSFPASTIFEDMLKNKKFNPFIIVIPNVARSFDYQKSLFDDTYQALRKQYGNRVIMGFDKITNTYLDLKNDYQLVFFSNPYKHYDYKKHNISYFRHKKVLPLYVNYAYSILEFCKEYYPFYQKMWRVSFENNGVLEFYKNITSCSANNAVVSGCITMDKYHNYVQSKKRKKKTILICPHHTVYGWDKLNISNFLRYAGFFLTLPKKYPNVNFIFRPHPLLWTHIILFGIWDKNRVDDYIADLKKNSNLIYDDSAEYFDKFAKSDAMIHDCGSFIAEYLYTGKPCCYMIRDKEATYSTLMPYGKKCMDAYYLAYEESDIINFIEKVVLKRKDPLKQKRAYVAKEIVTINYPKATEYFIDKINDDLK